MKVDLITLYADNTHTLKRCNVKGDIVKGGRGFNPKLTAGRCVFPRRDPGPLSLWKRLKWSWTRKKRFVIAVHGSENCFTLSKDAGKIDEHWNTDEAESFINKIIAWAAAKAKLFSKFEIYVFWILLAACIFMQMLILRRIGI